MDESEQLWQGADYCNYRITDIIDPVKYIEASIDRSIKPRMPWHDIAIRIIGGSVQDLSRHFIQYWNYVNFQINMNEKQLLLYAGFNEQ